MGMRTQCIVPGEAYLNLHDPLGANHSHASIILWVPTKVVIHFKEPIRPIELLALSLFCSNECPNRDPRIAPEVRGLEALGVGNWELQMNSAESRPWCRQICVDSQGICSPAEIMIEHFLLLKTGII